MPRLIWTLKAPSGSFNAPYLVEFVASSWKTRASGVTTSTIDEHFIAIDDEVFVFSTFIRPKQGADELL